MIRKKIASIKNSFLSMNGWQSSLFVRFMLFFALGLFLYAALSPHLITQKYDYEIGERPEKSIIATRDIYDEHATIKARQAARDEVGDVHTRIPIRYGEILENTFTRISQLNHDEDLSEADKVEIYRTFFDLEFEDLVRRPTSNKSEYKEALVSEIAKQLGDQKYRIPEEIYYKLPRLPQEQVSAMESTAIDITNRLMSGRNTDAAEVRAKVAEQVLASNLQNTTAREIVQEIIRFVITPNTFYDQAATLEAKQRAEESVEPVFIGKHEVIVREGQQITQQLHELLADNDLLRDGANYWPVLGLAMMVLLFLFVTYLFIYNSAHPVRTNNSQLLMFMLILVLTIAAMHIVSLGQSLDYPFIGYVAPVALGTMLISILLEGRMAYISIIIVTILASILFNVEYPELLFDFRYGFITAVVCFVAIFSLYQASQRATILKAGLYVSLFASIANAALLLLGDNEFELWDVVLSLVFSFGSGLITAVLVVG